jgi:hypothetical protein
VLLADQLRLAVAQGTSQPPSNASAVSAWRMQGAANAFLETLDDAAAVTTRLWLAAKRQIHDYSYRAGLNSELSKMGGG